MKRLILLGLLVALTCAPAAAQVFKCRNASGKTVYLDLPCPPGTDGGETGITGANAARSRRTGDKPPPAPPVAPRLFKPPPPPLRPPSAFEKEFQLELDRVAREYAKRDSAACKSAVRKANANDAKTKPPDIDRNRAAARAACGYDPWPGLPAAADSEPAPPNATATNESNPAAGRCKSGRC